MNSKIIIDSFCANPSATNIDSLIDAALGPQFGIEETAYLAEKLAFSGDQLTFRSSSLKADIPSTGGPSGLSTLLCPLILKELGFVIPKLGIKGRPAGGIDILNQIPGYRINFNLHEVSKILKVGGYCHFLVGESIAPLDKILFEHRSKGRGKSVSWLVTASILSKKIAVGLDLVGLDIRVGNFGNFGADMDQAESSAIIFNSVAGLAGIRSKCFLNDYSFLQQPFIGRGEGLVALHTLLWENDKESLHEHYCECLEMCCQLTKGPAVGLDNISLDKIKLGFIDNINVQGGSVDNFLYAVNKIKLRHQHFIIAEKDGFLHVDLLKLRNAMEKFQQPDNGSIFSDNCGVIFLVTQDKQITKGEQIMSIRITEGEINKFSEELKATFAIEDFQIQKLKNKTI